MNLPNSPSGAATPGDDAGQNPRYEPGPRARCVACGVEQPTEADWANTQPGDLAELCWWSDDSECRAHRVETFARLAAICQTEAR